MDPILDEKELATNWEDVKAVEFRAIRRRRQQAGLAPDPTHNGEASLPGDHNGELSRPKDLVGVALSGGGIRSACFNLGFLQALVERGVMRYVDYLSTVSGGGYIGSFFSSLAHRRWRERELARVPEKPDDLPPEPAEPLPLAPDPLSHKQPEVVRELVSRSRYLNDLPGFFNRYLVGTLLLNLTFLSGIVMACTLLAYLWRAMDQEAAVHYFIWYSGGVVVEAVRPFFPAFLILVFFWLPVWVWSFLRHGAGAPARHSGMLLILLLISLLVGAAIWLGTPNMNFENVLSRNFAPKDQSLSSWPSTLIYPLAGLLLLFLVPFVRPTELLKSGQQRDSPWKRWVFNCAGFALLVGMPFLLVYYIGRHNVSGVADRWDRDLVASDVLDWEDMLLRVANESSDVASGPQRPGASLRDYIEKESPADLTEEIKNTVKMVKFNRRDYETFLDYQTAQAVKRKIAAKMNEAITSYKFSYDILKSQHQEADDPGTAKTDAIASAAVSAGSAAAANMTADPADPANNRARAWGADIATALARFESLINKQPEGDKRRRLEAELAKIGEMLDSFSGRMSNLVILGKLAEELPAYIKDERSRLGMSAAEVKEVRAKIDDAKQQFAAARLSKQAEASANEEELERLRKERETLQDTLHKLRNEYSEAMRGGDNALVKQHLDELNERIKRHLLTLEMIDTQIAQLSSKRETLRRQLGKLERKAIAEREAIYIANPRLREEWYKIFFPTGIEPKAAGHLLLRLFYPGSFREIQFVNRPLVIAADQEYRGWLLLWSFIFFGVCGFLIDFNYSSLHGYYQSRLQRAFLVRFPPDHDGEEHRDLPLAALKNVEEGQPYHILSGAAETVHGRRREHRLTAFQFSRHYCGSTELGFAQTETYCNGRLSLADAMSISGAAVNPMRVENLLVKMLLVVTNFRLGQWLPHPLRGPRRCFVPLFRIAPGLLQTQPTNSQSFVFVADGGFYDNLGIDILLERRCRVIVAADAGADERIELADLARLYRLCQDKGIRLVNLHNDDCITMDSVLQAVKQHNLAVCRILYPGNGEGLLFHVKSFLVPPATLDLAHYQVTHVQFPHDATTNQFFDEMQFKCYQQLGWQIGQRVCAKLFPEEWHDKPMDLERLMQLLKSEVPVGAGPSPGPAQPATPEPGKGPKRRTVKP